MSKVLTNYELEKMFTCDITTSETLYKDAMTLDLTGSWEDIPFLMKQVRLHSKDNTSDLWLYYIEYLFGVKITLPTFVQPVDNELLDEKYRIYTNVISGGYWLCKPFEYKQQTEKNEFFNENTFDMNNYYHIGVAMSGLWPFD